MGDVPKDMVRSTSLPLSGNWEKSFDLGSMNKRCGEGEHIDLVKNIWL